jgi:hypothetical protein
MVLVLSAMAGHHVIEHLVDADGHSHDCAVCLWSHGANSNTLVWLDLAAPPLTAIFLEAGPDPCLVIIPRFSSPSRAPPANA